MAPRVRREKVCQGCLEKDQRLTYHWALYSTLTLACGSWAAVLLPREASRQGDWRGSGRPELAEVARGWAKAAGSDGTKSVGAKFSGPGARPRLGGGFQICMPPGPSAIAIGRLFARPLSAQGYGQDPSWKKGKRA